MARKLGVTQARVTKLLTYCARRRIVNRLLRALAPPSARKEETGVVEFELVKFAADAGSKEAQ